AQPEALLRRQEIRSPMTGQVVERKVDIGTAVGRDNLETELFTVADLGVVWVELAISPSDLPAIRQGQSVSISSSGGGQTVEGRIIFISPLLDKETRAARVVAEVDNASGIWRPSSFVTGAVAVDAQPLNLAVPTGAIQTIGTQKIVFVRVPAGFERRP